MYILAILLLLSVMWNLYFIVIKGTGKEEVIDNEAEKIRLAKEKDRKIKIERLQEDFTELMGYNFKKSVRSK